MQNYLERYWLTVWLPITNLYHNMESASDRLDDGDSNSNNVIKRSRALVETFRPMYIYNELRQRNLSTNSLYFIQNPSQRRYGKPGNVIARAALSQESTATSNTPLRAVRYELICLAVKNLNLFTPSGVYKAATQDFRH